MHYHLTPLGQQRLLAIVGRITQRPECWDQRYYHCNTSHCVAGHAQLDATGRADIQTVLDDAVRWLELPRLCSDDWPPEMRWLFRTRRTLAELADAAITGEVPE